MGCPTCKSPLKQDVVDQSGRRFDYCRGCGAQWRDHVSSVSTSSGAVISRTASVDRYERKLGRRSFTNEFRYRIGTQRAEEVDTAPWTRAPADAPPTNAGHTDQK